MYLVRQLNWAVKCAFFRSKLKSSVALRKNKLFIGIENRIELKCVIYLYQILADKRIALTNFLKLQTSNYKNNNRAKQTFFDNHC